MTGSRWSYLGSSRSLEGVSRGHTWPRSFLTLLCSLPAMRRAASATDPNESSSVSDSEQRVQLTRVRNSKPKCTLLFLLNVFFFLNQVFVSDEESNSPCAVRGLGRSSVVGVHAQYVGGAPLNPHGGWGRQDTLSRPGFVKTK